MRSNSDPINNFLPTSVDSGIVVLSEIIKMSGLQCAHLTETLILLHVAQSYNFRSPA